jgi:hypothetical protein
VSASCAAQAQTSTIMRSPLPQNSPRCECRCCGLRFKSESAYDAHRVGTYGIDRRCLTEAELRARGYEPDPRGYFRKPYPAGRAWRGAVPTNEENDE